MYKHAHCRTITRSTLLAFMLHCHVTSGWMFPHLSNSDGKIVIKVKTHVCTSSGLAYCKYTSISVTQWEITFSGNGKGIRLFLLAYSVSFSLESNVLNLNYTKFPWYIFYVGLTILNEVSGTHWNIRTVTTGAMIHPTLLQVGQEITLENYNKRRRKQFFCQEN